MSRWVVKKPQYGDHIRVGRNLYYHHGIYASDDEVYAFQSPKGVEVCPETAVVLVESLNDFLKDGRLEVREFTPDENARKRSPLEIVNAAREAVGSMGYDLINNNCEHFANKCVFGEARSEQVDTVKNYLRGLFGI